VNNTVLSIRSTGFNMAEIQRLHNKSRLKSFPRS